MSYRVGVLALQGDFAEHAHALEKCGVQAVQIRWAKQLEDIDGLIIPGGESTALAKLTDDNPDPIFDTIKKRALKGMPIYGTCMGSIFLAKNIEGSKQGRLALMDISVRRNAFGPQKNSFETQLEIIELGSAPFHAVFIRGPVIVEHGANVDVLATYDGKVVMARQENYLVTAFHPEITDDLRVHQLFVAMVRKSVENAKLASQSV